MVKLRSAKYCNLKLLLVYLVVYGHWIEPAIWDRADLRQQYQLIYLVHMPLFVFLTGLFIRSRADCLRQLKRLGPMYLLAQGAAMILGGGKVQALTPFWHLWYLLSCCFWMGAAWALLGLRRKWLVLAAAVVMGCLAGYVPWLGRTLSGSRTVVFFPWFWLGVLCRRDFPWAKYRIWGIAALGAALLLIRANQIPVTFLYQAAPYGGVENGAYLRLVCYAAAGLLGFFLLTLMPDRRFPWTRAGADTMALYLLHGPIVALLRQETTRWELCPLYAGVLIYVIYKILQWSAGAYGIVTERRDGGWRPLKKSTGNTENGSTDFCCP